MMSVILGQNLNSLLIFKNCFFFLHRIDNVKCRSFQKEYIFFIFIIISSVLVHKSRVIITVVLKLRLIQKR